MHQFVFGGLFAIAFTLALTPVMERLARRTGFLEYPSERRIHSQPVPLGGGLAIFLSFWLTLALTGQWRSELVGLLASSTVILVTGLIDDRRSLRPGAKFLGQLVASLLLIAFDTRIEFVTNPFGGMIYLGLWSIPITLLWLIAITNVVNFIDGLDGLAAGIVAIACAPLVGVALMMDRPFIALLAVVLAGSVTGFLPYNFNPARIMMGDTGALFLGFMLGAVSIEGALKGPTAIALAVPILALGLPIVDTIVVVIRRFRAGRPFYQADQGHVHHRLLALGYTQRQAVVLLYALSGIMGTLALLLLGLPTGQAVVWVGSVVLVLIVSGTLLGMQTDRTG